MNPAAAALPFRNPQLPLETRVNDLVSRLTLDEKVRMVHQYQPEIGRLGIGAYKHGTEGAHGISWLGKATSFPQPTGLASTWDPELLEKVGQAIGEEARGFYRRNPAVNGLTLWAPTVDMERDPRWGRTEEAYGEDPHLVAETAGALVKGMQGNHPTYLRAGATLKHFLGNNHEADRGTVSVTLDPRNLHEYYYRPFERVFRRAGAVSMMTAYNAVNGIPCNLNPDVQNKAKREWGCAFVVSDAGDVIGTNREHKWLKTMAEAVAANLKAGIDSFTDDPGICLTAVQEALSLGLIGESDLDEAVRNSLRVRFRFGEFDPAGLNPYEALGEEQIGSEAHRKLSLLAAEKSTVLLKNDGELLPLNPASTKSLAVVGPLADVLLRDWYSGEATHVATVASALKEKFASVATESGNDVVRLLGRDYRLADWGWTSHTFQDAETGLYLTTTDDKTFQATAKESFGWFTKEVFLVERTGDRAVMASWNGLPIRMTSEGDLEAVSQDSLTAGRIGIDGSAATASHLAAVKELCTPLTLTVVQNGTERAVAAARSADVAVVVVGCHPVINAKETVDRPVLDLPASQVALVRAVAAANPRTIVVVVSGYPYALDGILDVAPAILHTTHAGPEFPPAVANILTGAANPAGRTCLTWYASVEKLPPLTDYDVMRSGRTYLWHTGKPQFPFGHGLSYSRFEYLELQATTGTTGIKVKVRLANTSERPGEEVVQVYATVQGTVPHPRRQLVAFRRLPFSARETKALEFEVPFEDLEHWDPVRGRWVLDVGQVILAAGPSSGDLRVSAPCPLAGEAPSPRDLRKPTRASDWDDHEGAVLEYCREGGSAATFAWAAYHRSEFHQGIPRALEMRVSSKAGGEVTLRLNRPDGAVIARVTVAPARPSEVWRTLTAPVEGWVPGASKTVYLVSDLRTGREEGVAWFRLV